MMTYLISVFQFKPLKFVKIAKTWVRTVIMAVESQPKMFDMFELSIKYVSISENGSICRL